MKHLTRFAAALVCAAALAAPGALAAQAPSFLFTVSPGSEPGAPTSFVHADVGYGQRVFKAIGAERLEQRAGMQLALGNRFMLLGQAGFAAQSNSLSSHIDARSELLANVFNRSARRVFALGLGVARERSAQTVALGRVVAGYRAPKWEAMSNLRLERALGGPSAELRDGIDVITTAGAAHDIAGGMRLGLEAVGEDLEGFWDRNEAEGGAKLMIGPTLRVAPDATRWNFLVGTGAVMQLTNSTRSPGLDGPARDLQTRSGYIVRGSVAYRW
jgi:hypothetical protein